MNFENFNQNHMDFVYQPASQPAVRPSCARCRAIEITQNNRFLCQICETVVLKTIYLLHYGESFILPFITFFSIDTTCIVALLDNYKQQFKRLYTSTKLIQQTTVPFKYKFILTRVHTRGTMKEVHSIPITCSRGPRFIVACIIHVSCNLSWKHGCDMRGTKHAWYMHAWHYTREEQNTHEPTRLASVEHHYSC